LLHPAQRVNPTAIRVLDSNGDEIPSQNPNDYIVNAGDTLTLAIDPTAPDGAYVDPNRVWWNFQSGESYISTDAEKDAETNAYHTNELTMEALPNQYGSDNVVVITAMYAPNGVGEEEMVTKPVLFTIRTGE
jgi:hypothetical protein